MTRDCARGSMDCRFFAEPVPTGSRTGHAFFRKCSRVLARCGFEDVAMTTASNLWAPLAAASLLALGLAGCAGTNTGNFGTSAEPPPAPASAPPPPNMNPADFVGRWGYAAYQREGDRTRTEAAARGQCNNAYTIGR